MNMILKELTFAGSQGSTTDDLRDCLELMASGEHYLKCLSVLMQSRRM